MKQSTSAAQRISITTINQNEKKMSLVMNVHKSQGGRSCSTGVKLASGSNQMTDASSTAAKVDLNNMARAKSKEKPVDADMQDTKCGRHRHVEMEGMNVFDTAGFMYLEMLGQGAFGKVRKCQISMNHKQ